MFHRLGSCRNLFTDEVWATLVLNCMPHRFDMLQYRGQRKVFGLGEVYHAWRNGFGEPVGGVINK